VRLKLDENLGRRTARILAKAGHDVATVAGQGLSGFTDAACSLSASQRGAR
jgi:hypothetical protein